MNHVEPAVCVVTTLKNKLKEHLESSVQDIRDDLHIDVSVRTSGNNERYVMRLHQRPDFPELYDGLLYFTDHDQEGRIEMYIRFPRGQASQYAPLKVAEWTIARRDEQFPSGF